MLRLLIGNKNYSSWSLRPWLVLKHFEIAFQEELLLLSGEGWKERILERSPSGRVPVLIDGELVIPETIAIIEYLADTFPEKAIWPEDISDRALARSASAEMHAGFSELRSKAPMNLRGVHPGRIAFSDVAEDVARLNRLWSELITRSGGPFLFGAFSAVDAMYAPVATRLRTYSIPVTAIMDRYVAAIHELPAFVEWRQAGIAEPWIVEEDEIDVIQGQRDV